MSLKTDTVYSYLGSVGNKKGGPWGRRGKEKGPNIRLEFLCFGQVDIGVGGGASGCFPLGPGWASKPLTHSMGGVDKG